MQSLRPQSDLRGRSRTVAAGLSLVAGIALAYLAKGLMWRTPVTGLAGFLIKGAIVLAVCLIAYAVIDRFLQKAWS